MRNTAFGFFSTLVLILILLAVIIIPPGCNPAADGSGNGPGSASASVKNWVTLDIKFKSATNGEMRDMSMRALEKLVTDSAMARFPEASPTLTITQKPVQDSLSYGMSLGYALPLKDTTIGNPVCNCTNKCGVCFILNSYVLGTDTSKDSKVYQNIDKISFRDDEIKN